MKYSLIIPVYNRLDEVKEMLESAELFDFDRNEFEFLFVDDGSQDGFTNYIDNYQSKSGLNVWYICQQNQGPGAARNNGMKNAKGEYFIFVDSDCTFPPDYLQKLDKGITANKFDAFGGPDSFLPSFPPLLKAINYSMTSILGTGGTRGNKKHIGKFYPRSFNMGIHRRVYEKIGGMNKLRHGQDMDYSGRIHENGFKVGLIPDAVVYHKRRTSLPKFFRQIFNWGVARINLGKLHKSMLKPVHLLPATIVAGLFILLVLTPFFHKTISILWLIVLAGWLLICAAALLESFFKYKEAKTAFLSVITLNIQVFAYGFGLIWAAIQMIWKDEAEGITKNYYGKTKLESR